MLGNGGIGVANSTRYTSKRHSPLLAAPYFLASRMAFSARVSLVEATTFID